MSYHQKDIFALFPLAQVGCIYEIIWSPKITPKVVSQTGFWASQSHNRGLKAYFAMFILTGIEALGGV